MRRYWFRMGIILLEGILLLSITHPAAAWEEDKVAYLRYYYVPYSDLKEESGEIEMNAVKGMVLIPVSLSESVFLLPGLSYSGLYLDYKDLKFSYPTPDGAFTEKDLPRNLHVIDLVMGVNFQWDQEWGTFILLYPGIHSDLDDINGRDIYFSGVALATYRLSDTLFLSAGFYYDDSFGYPQLLPMLGAQWQISETLTLDAFLPQFMVFAYQADPRLAIGLKFNVEGNQYRLSKGRPWKNTLVQYTQILVGPFADFNLTEQLVLRIEGGFAVDREFEFRDEDTSTKLFNGDIKDNGYVGGSLALKY